MSRKSRVESRKCTSACRNGGNDQVTIDDAAFVHEGRANYGFENLDVWKKARVLAREVYALTSTGALSKDWALQGQMRRAAVSIVSNISEGAERTSQKEFAQFVSHAKGSCGELRAQIIVCNDVGFVDREKAGRLFDQAKEVSMMLGGLLASIQSGATRQRK